MVQYRKNRLVAELTLHELKDLRLLGTDQKIIGLEEALRSLSDYKVGLMIEIKEENPTNKFLDHVKEIIERYGFTKNSFICTHHQQTVDYFSGIIPVCITYPRMKELVSLSKPLSHYLVMGFPSELDTSTISDCRREGMKIFTTVKSEWITKVYPHQNPWWIARDYISFFVKMDIDYLNLDSCYHNLI